MILQWINICLSLVDDVLLTSVKLKLRCESRVDETECSLFPEWLLTVWPISCLLSCPSLCSLTPQALATLVMIQSATPRHPPPPIISRPSRLCPSRSRSRHSNLSSRSSRSSRRPPFSRHPSSWPARPGVTRAATWWPLRLETPTKSPRFTRASCRSPKGLPSSRSFITVTFARSAVQALR